MKASPLVLLSLGVLAGASPVPDSDTHQGRSEQGIEPRVQAAVNLAVAPNSAKTKARREKGALARRSRAVRRLRRAKQRKQRRDDDDYTDTDTNDNHDTDDDYSSCDEWTDDDGNCVAKPPAEQPPPPPAETHATVPQNDHDTDCDTDWSDEGEYERCKAKGLVTTAHQAAPTQPPPPPPQDDDYTSNPDEDTDCDTDWSDDGEHERCKAKLPATTVHQETQPTQPPPPPHDDDYTSNPDEDTDCDSDWSDDGEHERCRTKLPASATRFTQVALTTRHIAPTTAAVLDDTTDTDEDYYTDCDSNWSDDGEYERCRTKTISVTTTPAGAGGRPTGEPIIIENGANHGSVDQVAIIAGVVAAAAAFAI